MTIAELIRQLADAYGPDDEVDTFMLKAGDDPQPIFWPALELPVTPRAELRRRRGRDD